MGGPGGKDAAGGKAAKACATGPGPTECRCRRRAARRCFVHDRRAGDRELSSPLSPMQRPCRGVRCEHKVTVAVYPMALASEAPRHGSVTGCCRSLGWSRAHVRPAGGTRARRCRREDRRAGRLDGGADWALPARARLWPSLMCTATRERVQGPGRGDRGTDRGAASVAPRGWSGRPCGRNLRECSGPAVGGATARAPAGPGHCTLAPVRNSDTGHRRKRQRSHPPTRRPHSPLRLLLRRRPK